MRSRGIRHAVRAIAVMALFVGTTGGPVLAGVGAASANGGGPATPASTASSSHRNEFHPGQADEAFAKHRGRGYAKALGVARRRAATMPHAALPASASKVWTALGPRPESNPNVSYGGANSGRVAGLALSPGGTIYAATAGGGVWSTPDGVSWTTHTDTQPNIAMGSVAVDPSDSNVVFTGTGEDNSCLDCFYGSGIMESSDGGATWTTSNPGGMFTGLDVSSIVVIPGAASLATTEVLAGTNNGLYVSTNGGTTWTIQGGTGWSSGNVTSMVINPLTAPATIYAAVGDVGVERSFDNGSTWTNVDAFGGAGACSFPCNAALAIAPNASAASTILYVSIGSGTSYVRMDKSSNGGASWSPVTAPLFTASNYAYNGINNEATGDQSWYDNAIAIDPTNSNIVVAGGITAVETTDGGATWTNLNGHAFFAGGPPNQFHPDFHAAVFDGTGNLFIGTDGGVWKLPAADVSTVPPTTTLTNLNGNLDVTQFFAGTNQSGNASQILGGAQDNGTNLYTASAPTPSTWNEVDSGDGGASVIDPSNPLIQYAEADITVGGALDRTTNGWVTSSSLAPPFATANWVAPLIAVPGTSAGNGGFSTILMGGDYVFRSTSAGAAWSTLGAATSHHTSNVAALAVSPSNSSVLYAGFDDGTVQMSVDGGASWTIFGGVPTSGLAITHITVSATDPFTIDVSLAATFNGFPGTASGPKVLVGSSLNTTPTWTDVSANLPSGVPTNSVISDGASGLVVADDTGVYWASVLNGASTVWSRINAGMPNVQVMDVLMTSGGALVATTHGRGVWTFPFTTAVDGSGSMVVSPTSVVAGSAGNTLTFTYTAASGGTNNGELDVAVPAGWSAPSATATAAGFTTSTCGTATPSGATIAVTGITLGSGASCTIVFGSKASGGPGATAPTSIGTSTFTTTQRSTPAGTLTALTTSPSLSLIDTTAPGVTLTATPPLTSAASVASFSFTATDPDNPPSALAYTCAIDSTTATPCTSPAAYPLLANGQHTFTVIASDPAGNPSTAVSYTWLVDTVAPHAAITAPTVPFTLASSVQIAWTGADNAGGSGIDHFRLYYRRAAWNGGFGAWLSPSSWQHLNTTSLTATGLARGYTYCYAVVAFDRAGNPSSLSTPHCIAAPLDDRALTASSGWRRATGAQYWNQTITSTSRLGATLTRSAAALDRLAVVATRCPTCGAVGIYVNNTLVGKINLAAPTTHYRQLISLAPFRYRTGTVTIKVLTSGRSIQIDGLALSRT